MIDLYMGLPGYGKSLAIHDRIRTRPEFRYFVVEHSNEWGRDSAHWRRRPPARIFDVWEESGVQRVLQEFKEGKLPDAGVWRFIGANPWTVCRLAKLCAPCVYVDDEIDVAGRQATWEKEGNPLKEFVHRGRHLVNARGEVAEGHIFGACRRPQNIAKDLTDLCTQTFVFRLKGDVTRARLVNDNTIEAHQWDQVRALPKFHCLHAPSGRFLSIAPL